MITYDKCPVCGSADIHAGFSAKDHTVSHESFAVMKCGSCTLMFTQDVPGPNKIGKYYASENYISHSDTKKGLINSLYHRVRNITLNSKKNLLRKETGKPAGSVLDIGCGTGAFLDTMQKAGWQCTGLEPDENARKKAAELYNVYAKPAEEIYELPAGSYDAITMWHVLEHVHELHRYADQLNLMLAPGGKLFVAVPNYTSYDAAFYKENWAAYDVPRHLYHFSPQSMTQLMRQHGLSVKKIKPMWYDSFYVSMLSEKCRTGKGNILRAFFIGLVSNMKTMMKKDRCSSLIYIIEKV